MAFVLVTDRLGFQSTLPREERRIKRFSQYHCNNSFQSTLPREERRGINRKLYLSIIFQSTLPREERLIKPFSTLRETFNFNPRSHERSDTTSQTSCIKALDFNPRSHERSDRKGFYIFMDNSISIHAPTRGATMYCIDNGLVYDISIHAPTRGATAILHKKFVYFYTIPTINI